MAENKEAKMDLRLRPYKGKRPQLGKRVYVDPCVTLVGDITWPMMLKRSELAIHLFARLGNNSYLLYRRS